MLRDMYKVIKDHQPGEECGGELLRVEKGDILIDCEEIDHEWLRGKNMMSENVGKIPKSFVEAFSSNNEDGEKCIENEPLTEEHLTENPLLEAVDEFLDRDYSECGNLTKYKESNYVEMSSGETLNDDIEEAAPVILAKPVKNVANVQAPQKPRRCAYDPKTSDDGYNSGSHYSGENTDSNMPLLVKPKVSKQDEAGYEVPNVGEDIPLDEEKSRAPKTKRRSIFRILKRKGTQESKLTGDEEMRDKYYHPPTDFRDSYFLPQNSFLLIRMLLSFIAALGLSLTVLLVLILVCGLHPLLCLTLAFITFIIVQVAPVTLISRGILCVVSLIITSLVSTRGKVALVIFLFVMLISGPVLGMIDLMKFVLDCNNDVSLRGTPPTTASPHVQGYVSDYTPIQRSCLSSFLPVKTFCGRNYDRLQDICNKRRQSDDTKEIIELCAKPIDYFCNTNETYISMCTSQKRKVDSTILRAKEPSRKPSSQFTRTLRKILLYLSLLLILLILNDAYEYNRTYLSTKSKDNIYITQRLRELDQERKNRGLSDLIFPLTRIEFHTYLVRRSFTWSKSEKWSVLKWLLMYVIVLFVAVSLVLLENRIYVSLSHTQSNVCRAENEIRYRLPIYAILGILLFLIFIQSHVLRMRSTICDYFYSDMVDIRSKHLYYKILHDRHTFARHVRRKIHLLSEEKRLSRKISFTAKVFDVLPVKLQNMCSKLSMRRCMICNSISYHKTVECKERSCLAHYCFECFIDAGQQCLTCKSAHNSSSSLAV